MNTEQKRKAIVEYYLDNMEANKGRIREALECLYMEQCQNEDIERVYREVFSKERPTADFIEFLKDEKRLEMFLINK